MPDHRVEHLPGRERRAGAVEEDAVEAAGGVGASAVEVEHSRILAAMIPRIVAA
jgi:hypothetical protein